MEQRLKPKEITSLLTPNRVEHYRVVPLKLALKQLELKLSQVGTAALSLLQLPVIQGLLIPRVEILDPYVYS